MAKLLSIHPQHPEPRKIRQLVELLKKDAIISYPTDTVYALGCSLYSKAAIEKLSLLKNRPKDQFLTLLCGSMSELSSYALMEDTTYRLIRKILPGPYTCILTATREVPKNILPKRKELGIRIPDAPIVNALIQELGHPLLSTTAETVDGELLQWPEEIVQAYGTIDFVIDGGPGGLVPTTVLDFTKDPPLLVREGAGSLAVFEEG